jgi:MFS transporter, AAHS family, 4-hydroxybenzoate transporter
MELHQNKITQVLDQGFSFYQCLVIFLCFLIALLDGFDTQAVAFTGPAIIEAFDLEAKALAPVLTAGIIGMTIGAMGMGILGDRWGRRKTLMACVLVFGVATLLTAYVNTLEQIFILRVIAGLGMGGATPVLLALAAEYSPSRFKGLVTTGVLLALPAGAMLGGLLAASIIPIWGWQSIYFIGGGIPLLLLMILFFILPESLQYLSQRKSIQSHQSITKILNRITPKPINLSISDYENQQNEKIKAGRLNSLFQQGLAKITIAVWGTYFFNWIAWFMLLSWLPTILKQAGLEPSQAPYASVTVNAAFILFALPLAYYLPKLNTIKILSFMFICGVLIACALGLTIATQQWGMIFILIALAGFGIGGQQLALNYLVIASYPTEVRATATGWAIGMGRLGAIIGSAVGGIVLTWSGVNGYFFTLAMPLVIALICVLTLTKKQDTTYAAEMN